MLTTNINPNIIKFWEGLNNGENMSHRFFSHSIISKIGHKYCLESFEEISKKPVNLMDMGFLFQDIMRIESPHIEELKQLAINTIKDIWNIDIPFNLDLGEKPDSDDYDTEESNEEPEPEYLFDQINKRITLNLLIQGCAINQLLGIHHLVHQELDELNPSLFSMYDKFISGSMYFYWLMDFDNPEMLMAASIGKEEIEWNEDQPEIKAQSMIFPILFHEMTKGVVELICIHGLSDLSEEDQQKVIQYADKIEYEPYHIQVGFILWRKILKNINKNDLPNEIMKMSKMSPNDLHNFISLCIED